MDFTENYAELLNEIYFDWLRSGYNLNMLREEFFKLVCKNCNYVNNYDIIQNHLQRETIDLTPQFAVDYNNIDINYILQLNPSIFESIKSRNTKLSSDVLNIFFAHNDPNNNEGSNTKKKLSNGNQIIMNKFVLQRRASDEPKHNLSMNNSQRYCSFCKKNGEPEQMYKSHVLYCSVTKQRCPILQSCVCSFCKEQGHTIAHCKKNSNKNSILKLLTKFNRMDIYKGEN